jgi:hypothetical protein
MSFSEFFKIYNNNILTQSKCGTRFLNNVFGKCNEIISLNSLLEDEYKNRFNVVIVRDPYEHLLSAISTTYGTYGTIDTQLNVLSKGTDPHWNPNLFKYLYIYGLKNKITILHLKDITNYIENVLNLGEHINETPFQTVKITNKTFLDNLNKNHEYIWFHLNDLLKTEYLFYHKLIEENQVYRPKLKLKLI